jgi:hypothetical protein
MKFGKEMMEQSDRHQQFIGLSLAKGENNHGKKIYR